jgi:hypothetical protein
MLEHVGRVENFVLAREKTNTILLKEETPFKQYLPLTSWRKPLSE